MIRESTLRLRHSAPLLVLSLAVGACGPSQARGPTGALHISDSQVGRIWRVIYTGD